MPLGTLNSTGFHLQYAWINPEKNQFRSIGAGWLCEINPKFCQEQISSITSLKQIARQDLETFFHFPLEVLNSRFEVFLRAWFSGEGPGATGNFDAIGQGILLLLLLVGAIFAYFLTPDSQIKLEIRVYLVFFLASLAPYLMTHVEVRFMIPAKVLIIALSGRLIVLYSKDSFQLNFSHFLKNRITKTKLMPSKINSGPGRSDKK
jgi:hypothetical protein